MGGGGGYCVMAAILKMVSLVRPNTVGLQKNKNEQISVGHFCGKHAMGSKNPRKYSIFLVGQCFSPFM